MQKQSVWLIGASQMASDYVDVLTALEQDVTIIGRGPERAEALQATTAYPVIAGGVSAFLATTPEIARCRSSGGRGRGVGVHDERAARGRGEADPGREAGRADDC